MGGEEGEEAEETVRSSKMTTKKDELQATQTQLKFLTAMIVTLVLIYALTMSLWMDTVNSRLDSLEEKAEEAEIFDLLNQFP